MNGDTFDALVIGGGINGLSALYHLKRLGAERVGLVERFSIGHDRGSSHGAARVTRSAYIAPEYVRLMQWVHAEEWPRIEKAVGKQLVYSNPGIYTGVPCERLDRYINAVQQEGVDVELISAGEARERFPQFTFVGRRERPAGQDGRLRRSERSGRLTRRPCPRERGDNPRKHHRPRNRPDERSRASRNERGNLQGRAPRSWRRAHGRGICSPSLKPILTISRQTVGYFTPGDDPDAYRPGRFPVWVYMEQEENDLFYGMPEFGRAGVKVARHMRVGVDDDPE